MPGDQDWTEKYKEFNTVKKPANEIFEIVSLGRIFKCEGIFTHDGMGTMSWTHVELTGEFYDGRKRKNVQVTKRFEWCTISEYLDYDIDHCSIMQITDKAWDLYTKWQAYEKKNKKELAEYERLKKKFG